MNRRMIDVDRDESGDPYTEELVARLFAVAFPEICRRGESQQQGEHDEAVQDAAGAVARSRR